MNNFQHQFISDNATFNNYTEPFKHIIIDNLFIDPVYSVITNKCNQILQRTNKAFGQVGTNPNNVYDAIIQNILRKDCDNSPLSFLVSEAWKNYIASVFNIKLNMHTAFSTHFHKGSEEAPSKDGWVHTDLNICSVINDDNNKIKLTSENVCPYADDTVSPMPFVNKTARAIACLYYFNNKTDLNEGDGGGTGLYTSYNLNSLVKNVLPVNNRFIAFEISPTSYHGFLSAKFDRSALVQWFHTDPAYLVHKNLDKFKIRYSKFKQLFELWKDKNLWRLDMDPEYPNYFNKPFTEIFQ